MVYTELHQLTHSRRNAMSLIPKSNLVPIVRSIMRECGAGVVYNNKHKTMRSVKCYADIDRMAFWEKMTAFMQATFPDVKYEIRHYRDSRTYRAGSVVVRFPNKGV
jgi:hypothetical protein